MRWNIIKHIRECLDWLYDVGKRYPLPSVIFVYFIVVVSFAFVNWRIFVDNSTSYLISDQLNKHVERYDILDPEIDLAAYHRNAKDQMPLDLNGFGELMKSDMEKLQRANDSLIVAQEAFELLKEEWDELSRTASRMMKDSIETVRDEQLSGYRQSIDSLQNLIKGKDSTEMMIEGKYVELAKLQHEYAKRNAKVESMYTQYIGNFIPDSLSHEIRKRNEGYLELTQKIWDIERQRNIVSNNIRNSVSEFHKNRLESVSWWDFLYYSICVSTTVSFGDIAPNNGTTRCVAVIELLICLLIVGYIVDRIIKRKKNGMR